ncbi:MAG: glycoside hydrolase family 20 zincin-like fold domain-containing protein [Acidimicrobiales bacterium]
MGSRRPQRAFCVGVGESEYPAMSHPVIPSPAQFEGGGREFVLRSGTRIIYTACEVAPIVERFCSEVARRTGLHVAPDAGHVKLADPSVTIDLALGSELDVLPAPVGVSPTGAVAADERHSLMIDGDQIVIRAVEPVGVARGLTTLLQLVCATRSSGARDVSLREARMLDAPRYAWRVCRSTSPARSSRSMRCGGWSTCSRSTSSMCCTCT